MARLNSVTAALDIALVLSMSGYSPSSAFAAPAQAPSSVAATLLTTCAGPHDLVVANGPYVLEGDRTFDRICVQDHGILMTGRLALHTGYLFVARGSSIDANGPDGGFSGGEVCGNSLGSGDSDAAPGGNLTIVAAKAFIQGSISANGGRGLAGGYYCDAGDVPTGSGGNGGHIMLQTGSLNVTGSISANGGNGGSGAEDPIDGGQGGYGGNGGTVEVRVSAASYPVPLAALHVQPGAGGPSETGFKASHAGSRGQIRQRRLTNAEIASLPAEPAPLLTILQGTPSALPPSAMTAKSPVCHAGDLVVPAGKIVTLVGDHTYGTICIHAHGLLRAGPTLQLIASAIVIDKDGRLSADGSIPPDVYATGDYEFTGPRTLDESVPHAGVPGRTVWPDCESLVPGGSAGGALFIIAQKIVVNGVISANGGSAMTGNTPFADCGGSSGSGGGSGGGISIIANQLLLNGTIAALGGVGGAPGDGGYDASITPYWSAVGVAQGYPPTDESQAIQVGPVGTAGDIKIFVQALYAQNGTLHVYGMGVLGFETQSV